MKIESCLFYDGVTPHFVDVDTSYDFSGVEACAQYLRRCVMEFHYTSVICFTDNGRVINIDKDFYTCVIVRRFENV